MATLSEPVKFPDRVQALFDSIEAERAELEALIAALSVTLDHVRAERDRFKVLADLAVAQYEADRAWQLAPEHREDLWETWSKAHERFEVAVAEEVERRGR